MKIIILGSILSVSLCYGQDWKTETDLLIKNSEFQKARSLLDKELAKSPNEFEAIWRKSRLETFVADELPEGTEKESGYEKAYALAKSAIKLSPKKAAGHLRLATAAGKIALFKGVLEAKDYVNQVKTSAEEAIKLQDGGPEIQGWAHYVLGRAHLKLSETPAIIRRPIGLGWGNISEAEKNLKIAQTLLPNSVLVNVEVAKLYKKLENTNLYRLTLEKAKQLPVSDPTDKLGKKELTNL